MKAKVCVCKVAETAKFEIERDVLTDKMIEDEAFALVAGNKLDFKTDEFCFIKILERGD